TRPSVSVGEAAPPLTELIHLLAHPLFGIGRRLPVHLHTQAEPRPFGGTGRQLRTRHVELGLVLADEQHRQLALESVDHCSHRHPATSSSCTSDSFRFDVSESLL